MSDLRRYSEMIPPSSVAVQLCHMHEDVELAYRNEREANQRAQENERLALYAWDFLRYTDMQVAIKTHKPSRRRK